MDRQTIAPYLNPMTPHPTGLDVEGELHHPIKCLLCDIYGTLLISGSGDIGVARKRAAKENLLDDLLHKYKIKRPPEMLRQDLFAAIEKDHRINIAKGIDYPEVAIDKIWATILPFGEADKIRSFAAEWEMVVNPVWPMPGLRRMIQACKDEGMVLGIISNAQFFTPLLFEWLLDDDLASLGFDLRLIYFSYLMGRAKPSQYLFETAAHQLETLGIARDQTAFIGNDMRNDIVPARKVGFQTILFAGDERSLRFRAEDPDFRTQKPELRITHLTQLIPMVIQAK